MANSFPDPDKHTHQLPDIVYRRDKLFGRLIPLESWSHWSYTFFFTDDG